MLDKTPTTASDIMVRDVVSVHPDSSLGDAAKLMAQYGISGLPVVSEQGEVVGMISEGDLVRRFHNQIAQRSSDSVDVIQKSPVEVLGEIGREQVGAIMISNVVGVPETMPASELADLMHAKNYKRLPVLENGRLIGIVTRSDLVRALVAELEETLPHPSSSPGATGQDQHGSGPGDDVDSKEARHRLNVALRGGRTRPVGR